MTKLTWISLLALAIAAPVRAQDEPAGIIAREAVESAYAGQGDALDLARQLFGDERVDGLASARLWHVTYGSIGYRLALYGPAQVNDLGLCERRQYRYDIENPHPSLRAPAGMMVAVDERAELGLAIPQDGTCPTDDRYARAREGLHAEATRQQLSWLWQMVTAAQAGEEIPVSISCATDEPGRCDDTAEALASLPFEALRSMSVTGPVRVERRANGRESRTATLVESLDDLAVNLSFNYDGRTMTAWQVSWRVINGEVRQINLRRPRVTYH